MNYKLSKLAIGLAAVCAFSAQANATTLDYSTLISTGYNITETFSGTGAIINDTFNFTLPSTTDIGAGVNNNITSTYNFHTHVTTTEGNISDLSLSLFNGFNAGGTQVFSGVSVPGGTAWELGAGNYSFDVTGQVSGTKGGSYTLNTIAAPVPEPTEGALLLSGFALLGFIAARRNRNEA